MLKGIDVSHWKSDLHLGSVAADFVIAKATGGDGFVDESCDMFVQAARTLGRKWGVYHYYSDGYGGGDPIKEANWFVDNVWGYVGEGMLILDWEKGGNPYWGDVKKAKAWLDHVYKRTGVRALLYVDLSTVKSLDWSSVIAANYGLWVAAWPAGTATVRDYDMDPAKDPNPHWDGVVNNVLWQFTANGRIKGYGGDLDCNFFYGTRDTWDAYCRTVTKTVTAKPAPKPAPKPVPTTTTTTTKAKPAPTTTTTTTLPTTTTTTTKIIDVPQEPVKNGGHSMSSINKAIAGLLAGFIVTLLAKYNIIISDNLPDVIEALLGALTTALVVYFAPKNKQ